jgi:hypothetical protein
MDDCFTIARKELGLTKDDDLPSDLFNLLIDADNLCTNAGGEFHSRQAVALVILIWRGRQ